MNRSVSCALACWLALSFGMGLLPRVLALPDAATGRPLQAPASPQQSGAPTAKPPGYRWLVKTASDADVSAVDPAPHSSTVEKLLDLPRPDDMPRDGSNTYYLQHRARPAETTVYAVEADVIACRLAADRDIHVTIRGASGKTLVLELPPADSVDHKSPFFAKLKVVRKKFEDKFKPDSTDKAIAAHTRLTGIAFFNRDASGKSAEGNLIQLHPVLSMDWLRKPTKAFAAPAG